MESLGAGAIAVLAAGVALGAATQAALGFGAILVATIVGAWVVDTDRLMPLLLPLSTLQTAVVVARSRAEVDRGLLFGRILPAFGLGAALGAVGIGVAAPGLARALGALVLALAGLELTRPAAPGPLPRPLAAAALVGGGVVQAAIGTGGPLVVWAVGREGLPPAAFRSTLNATWLATNLALGAALAARGRFTAASLVGSALLAAPALVGVAAGLAAHRHVPPASFRRALWVVLAACAAPLLLR